MRITASWSRSLGSTEYKYVARCSALSWRAPLRSSQTPSTDMPKHARRDLALDGKIPIQVVGHCPAAATLDRQSLRLAYRYGRYVTFQMAEVAVPRQMFQDILSLIARLRAPPAPA